MKDYQQSRKQPEVTGVRLGEMRGQVEKHCKALGIDLSEFIRGSIQKAIRPKPVETLASLFGVIRSFDFIVDAAYRLGWITAEDAADLTGSISVFQTQISNRLDAAFAEEHPEIVKFEQESEQERKNKLKVWRSSHKGQEPPDELLFAGSENSARERWRAGLARAFAASDLKIVFNSLRELRVEGVDLRRSDGESDSQ